MSSRIACSDFSCLISSSAASSCSLFLLVVLETFETSCRPINRVRHGVHGLGSWVLPTLNTEPLSDQLRDLHWMRAVMLSYLGNPANEVLIKGALGRHLRLKAGVPDNATVDLSLIRLPANALMFPSPPALADGNFERPRHGVTISKDFARVAAKLGFPGLRFHDLRGTHGTLLLDRSVPVHTVAARLGHDPATLLRSYAKKTKKADVSAASIIGSISKSILS